MSLRFTDSFDHYVTADITEKWTAKTGSPTITASGGRRSTPSLQCGSSSRGVSKALDAQATWVIGVAVKVNSFPSGACPLLGVLDAGSVQCDVRLVSDGTLRITRNGTTLGTTTFALSSGVSYYVEFKATINDATGTAEIKVDGSSKLALTSQDTKSTANATANSIYLGDSPGAGNSCSVDFDDLYVCDGAGSTNNNFLGDCRVDAYLPSGAGNSTQLTPSAGSNYQCVDESAPNDDTDYVEHATVGNLDDYAFADMTHTPSSIFGIQVLANAKKDDAGARSLATVTRSGSTNYAGATQALSTSYLYYSDVRETDPDTAAAWTIAGFIASSHGVKVAA
jgi:hypothetical protein